MQDSERRDEAERVLAGALAVPVGLDADPAALTAHGADPERIPFALGELAQAGIAVSEMSMGQPSLDEVFLSLTGHPTDEPTSDQEDVA